MPAVWSRGMHSAGALRCPRSLRPASIALWSKSGRRRKPGPAPGRRNPSISPRCSKSGGRSDRAGRSVEKQETGTTRFFCLFRNWMNKMHLFWVKINLLFEIVEEEPYIQIILIDERGLPLVFHPDAQMDVSLVGLCAACFPGVAHVDDSSRCERKSGRASVPVQKSFGRPRFHRRIEPNRNAV